MQKLARKMGTSQQQIDRLEKGKRRLTVEWMEKLSSALDCGIMDLLPDAHKERDFISTTKAKVIGAIDAENDGRLIEFEEREVYTLIFGRPKNIVNPRLFALIVRGEGLGFSEGAELILSEIDRNQNIPNGATVLCAARTGQFHLRRSPNAHPDEVVKAILVKTIQDA